MENTLSGKAILVLLANGFEENQFTLVQRALLEAGAKIYTVGLNTGLVNSWNGRSWGLSYPMDAQISTVLAADHDVLFVPGGHRCAEQLAKNLHTARILRGFADAGKPMALLGHAAGLLAGLAATQGLTVTGPAGCRKLLEEAGAIWQDENPATDKNILTSEGAVPADVVLAHLSGALPVLDEAAD